METLMKEILKNPRVAILVFISCVCPSIMMIYIYNKDLFLRIDVFKLLLFAISIGVMYNISCYGAVDKRMRIEKPDEVIDEEIFEESLGVAFITIVSLCLIKSYFEFIGVSLNIMHTILISIALIAIIQIIEHIRFLKKRRNQKNLEQNS